MRFILEMNGGLLEFSETLDETLLVSVDQNIVYGRIFEEWLDRAKGDGWGPALWCY